MLRLVHLIVIAALVLAAAKVYEIKFSSTLQAERVAQLRADIRRERDAIAALRAEWAQLENPDRIQRLARRHLALRPVDAIQFDSLDNLPDRSIELVPPDAADPIGAIIESTVDDDMTTATVPNGEGGP